MLWTWGERERGSNCSFKKYYLFKLFFVKVLIVIIVSFLCNFYTNILWYLFLWRIKKKKKNFLGFWMPTHIDLYWTQQCWPFSPSLMCHFLWLICWCLLHVSQFLIFIFSKIASLFCDVFLFFNSLSKIYSKVLEMENKKYIFLFLCSSLLVLT